MFPMLVLCTWKMSNNENKYTSSCFKSSAGGAVGKTLSMKDI